MTIIKIKKKVYQIRRLKGRITLIQERRIINSIKIQGIIIKGIKEVAIKVLNHRILQQETEKLSLLLIRTLHRQNP